MELEVTPRQRDFMQAKADEVLFGGAAGGGKSYAQLIDALLYALRWPGSKQLLLRRTYPDLERSLVQEHLKIFPRECYRYAASSHKGVFENGSTVEFGFCDHEKDVYRYQGAEYDTIRFDELTHFTENQYLYLMSRLRGANSFPKQVKSSTNPGGIGHGWVKARFVDIGPADTEHRVNHGSRIFLPSFVRDNTFLMKKDPGYLERLMNLDETNRKALLYGNWDIFEGQYFTEFDREKHVCRPFALPEHWRRYITIDYGMDMLAAYWVAVDEQRRAWVYRELYRPGLIISRAAQAILEKTPKGESIEAILAPPDLWNARQETGKSAADLFGEEGLLLTQTSNRRVDGWLAVREWLALRETETGEMEPRLKIFSTCANLIRTLPALAHDRINVEDAANEPHELTHAPDALRGFCVYWTTGSEPPRTARAHWNEDQYIDYKNATPEERDHLIRKWGNPF